ncbi:hypothetical protein M9Y10_024379 [Tritrichomonas musculus]|uniref:Uncharacterized protein n=1 Tax=Tritrichomonas musculus TaxID=1915356 RepID=A0ABR2HCV6_9EUKA
MFIMYSDFYGYNCDVYLNIMVFYEEALKKISKFIAKDDEICVFKSGTGKIKVEEVIYIDDIERKILIKGRNEMNNCSVYIKEKDIFDFFTSDYEKVKMIEKMDSRFERYKIYKECVSDIMIRRESFRILREYMENKNDKIIYGFNVISNIENNDVKVVFVVWSFVKNLNEKLFKMLTNKENKYKDVNIVVFGKGDEYYEEIKNYGGIVGVIN